MSRLRRLLTEPAKRPQLVVWIGVTLVVMAVVVAVSTIGTSTNSFCTDPCHMVHADNTMTFERSSHVMLSCVACHEPVNGSPVTLVLLKLEVAPDIVPTVLGTFELPMNDDHSVALEMPDEQCTQCHSLENRSVTASAGILIDHDVHTASGISCTSCHNRVAHPEEDVVYVLEGDRKHEDWMGMDACFRCHSLESGAMAPGACAACHPADFDLVPPSHYEPGWYEQYGESSGHAAAASEEASRAAAAEELIAGFEEIEHSETIDIGYERSVNTCFTCHARSFCTDCHGVEMPHPAGFATDHGTEGTQNPQACSLCHARNEAEAQGRNFCNACHHPQSTPDQTWIEQHYVAVIDGGARPCFDCHNPRYCSACHVGGAEAAARYMREQAGQ